MKRAALLLMVLILSSGSVFAQFGKNRVQHKEFDWFYIQTKHFDIYFSEEGKKAAEFAAAAAEDALDDLQSALEYKVNNRLILILYNSHNDFQETNTSDSYLSQGIGGFTEPFKNRMVLPFEGDYQKFRHVIHHELFHAYLQDMIYGGSLQNIISKGISLQLPLWYHEGMAEYLSTGWDTNSDMFIADAIINDYLPTIDRLSGYFAYRGGQSLFRFIAEKYGEKKLAEILRQTKELNSLPAGIKASTGLTIEELNDKWRKDVKKRYWPQIAKRTDPDEFAKRITNNKKTFGFYNSSPAISPRGDKVAFISDRDIFFNVYVQDLNDEKNIEVVAESGTTNDFEELNVLTPALTWSPDNRRIALSVKSDGYDAIKIIDTETKEFSEIPVKLEGIASIAWSPDGEKIALEGHDTQQSDIYVFNLETKKLDNLTNDIFTDSYPSWSPDSKTVFFSSDRGEYFNKKEDDDFIMYAHNYHQLDLFCADNETKKIKRLTNWDLSNEQAAVLSEDGKKMLFVSDKNGITNLYVKSLEKLNELDDLSSVNAQPLTNSINGINQLSISKDGKKLVFSSLYNSGYNIFLINNPFGKEAVADSLEYTPYMASVAVPESELKNELLAINDKNDSTKTESYKSFVFGKVKSTKATIHKPDLVAEKDTTENQPTIFTGDIIVNEPVEPDSVSGSNYTKFVFGHEQKTFEEEKPKVVFEEKLDTNGNFLKNKYRINFTADLIYANAGYSTFYGLLGTTVLSFSDVLGNHRLIGVTNMQVDLKNSDYGLAYYYLANRTNLGFEMFHTARFLRLSRPTGTNLFRFRNFGLVASASYPINTFRRFDFGLSMINVTAENLDDFREPVEKVTYINPTMSYVFDNTFWGYYSPIQGTRYKITAFGDPGITDHKRSFYSVVWDFRQYYRFWFDNSFVFRISGGYSGGGNPQRFMLGGTENWINRDFVTGNIPLNNASDFAFLTPALPMRGYIYGEQIGTKYSLVNIELRMPIIRYLLTGPLPLLFQNVLGTAFIDAGTAWNDNNQLQLFHKNEDGKLVTKDLLLGVGTGIRTYLLFFLARFDVAWAWDLDHFKKPRYYFSLGVDF